MSIKAYESSQTLAEEYLELIPCDQDKVVCVSLLLVLLLAKPDPVPKEERGKRNLGRLRSSSGCKVVLTLLIEVVAIHVRLFAIYVQGMSLQLIPRRLGDDESWDRSRSRSLSLWNSLKNLLQVTFRILGDISNGDRSNSNGGFCP